MTDQTRIIFLHIPKTGGTTLESYFKDVFPLEERFCESDPGNKRYELTQTLERAALFVPYDQMASCFSPLIDDKRYYSGHICYGFHRGLPPGPYKYISVIRNPIDRVVSYLNTVYTVSRDRNGSYAEWLGRGQTSGKHYERDNYQTRALLAKGWLNEPAWHELDQTRFDEAIATLEAEFIYGVTEDISGIVHQVREVLHIDLAQEERRLNVTKEGGEVKGYPQSRFEKMPLTDSDMEDIERRHQWDLKLYEYAKSRVTQR